MFHISEFSVESIMNPLISVRYAAILRRKNNGTTGSCSEKMR